MLFWTCPECGRECSPEIRECPACVKAQQAVQTVQAAPVLTANGNSGPATATVVLAEEGPKVPGGETIDSLVRPLVESVIDPRQLALPGLEPLSGSQVEAEITSLPAESTLTTTAAAKVAAPVESAVVATVTACAETTQPVVASAPAKAPVQSAVVAPVTTPTEATQPVVTPLESLVAPAVESTEVATASAPAKAPIKSAVVAPVMAPTEANQSVVAPLESLVAPAVESTEVATASAPAKAPIKSAVLAPVMAPTEATQPVVTPLESLVAPAVESTEVATASAPAKAPVESVAPIMASTEATQPVAPLESVIVAPASESTKVVTASAPAEAPVVVAPVTETAPATPIAEPIQPVVAAVESPTAVVAPTAESAQPLAASPETSVVAPPESSEMATAVAPADPSVEPVPISPPAESTETAVETAEASDQARLSAALKLQAETVLDAIALQAEVDQSGILAICETFRKSPKTSLLTAPLKLVTAPAPPAEQWKRTPRPIIPSRKPDDPKPALLASGPQTSTLAGPCLPRELRTLIEDRSSAQAHARKRAGFPTWMVSVVVATFLFLGAGSLLQYVTGNRDAKAAAPASGQSSASPTADRHPLARFVEVTGLRVIADLNHKSQLQYIVVNHSSTQISGMAIKIAVRSAAGSAESTPLFIVSASVPSLAPYQSKEIRTDLDAELHSTAIPDWENLRADVQVNTRHE